jgi:hypothetical protein
MGAFSVKGRLRATAATLRIRDEGGAWRSQVLNLTAGTIDLGRIVLGSEKPSGRD